MAQAQDEKKSDDMKSSTETQICKFRSSPALIYRLYKIDSNDRESCGQLIVSKDSGKAKLLVSSENKFNFSKLNRSKAVEVFGNNSNLGNSFRLKGISGNRKQGNFHIDLRFDNQGYCSKYRVRGPGIKSTNWILTNQSHIDTSINVPNFK
tara:strand:- start:214 stop:666 length:453 start_codon:yes stop_codon:yes gene_type:complete